MIGIAAVALVATGIAVVVPGVGDDEPRDDVPSVVVDDDPSFVVGQTPSDHRIVYVLTDPQGGRDSETDRVWVRSPFESRLETASGTPPGGDAISVQVGDLRHLRIGGVSDAATVARVPGLAPSSIRLAPIIDDAIDAGLLERREQREVAGRRCQVFRSGSTLGSGPLRPITGEEFADSCVDADGLLLEETLFVDDSPVFRRTAVEVEVGDIADDDLFATGDPTAPVDRGGGSTVPAAADSFPVGTFWVLPDDGVPDGFRLRERFSVIPPQPDRFADPTLRDAIIAGVADVYVRDDGRFFVAYQGGTLGGVPAFPSAEEVAAAEPVDAGAVGDGAVLLSALGTEVRIPLDGGRFVHVIGPLPPMTLVEIARSLEAIEGDGLVLLDE